MPKKLVKSSRKIINVYEGKEKQEVFSLAVRHTECFIKKSKDFFFSGETYTRGFVIVFSGSQISRKLKNYCN